MVATASFEVVVSRKVVADSSVEGRVELLGSPRHDLTDAVMDSRNSFVRAVDAGIIMLAAVTWAVRVD